MRNSARTSTSAAALMHSSLVGFVVVVHEGYCWSTCAAPGEGTGGDQPFAGRTSRIPSTAWMTVWGLRSVQNFPVVSGRPVRTSTPTGGAPRARLRGCRKLRIMISVDGAGLLAQILPVGVVILALDARVLSIASMDRSYRARLMFVAGLSVVGTLISMASIVMCVGSVASSVPIVGWQATVVGFGSYCLAGAVSAVVGSSLSVQIWGGASSKGKV
jgi:hypothetical protein